MAQIMTTKQLPALLRAMADYLKDDCLEEEYPTYWKEIVSTGLFHDAVGKVVEAPDEYVRVTIDY